MVVTAPTVEVRLTEEIELARVRHDRFVILEALPYYAQLMPNHGVLYGEVVSNHSLRGSERLSARQEGRLLALGWTPPDVACHPYCPSRSHPNFTMTWPSTTQNRHLARDLLRALIVMMAAVGEGGSTPSVRSSARVTEPSYGSVPGH